MSQQTHTTKKELETAILVGVQAQTDEVFDFESTMEELASLSETCQLNVQAEFTQNRQHFDNKYYVGKGKLEDIKAYIEMNDIDVLVANDELNNGTVKNILEIFALRAEVKEGKHR